MRLYIAPEDEFSRPTTTYSAGSGAHYKPDFASGIARELKQNTNNDYEGKFTVATVKRPNLLVIGGILYVAYTLVIK